MLKVAYVFWRNECSRDGCFFCGEITNTLKESKLEGVFSMSDNQLDRDWVLRNLYRLPENFKSYFNEDELEEQKQHQQIEVRSLEEMLTEIKSKSF